MVLRNRELFRQHLSQKKNEGRETRTLTHFHYDGWKDGQAAPSEELLQKLCDLIEEKQEGKKTPFEVNCKAGIGRTGTLVLCHYLRQKIMEELGKGVELDKIRLNIPEALYAFRKQRPGIIGAPDQLAQVYSITASFVERLKNSITASKK